MDLMAAGVAVDKFGNLLEAAGPITTDLVGPKFFDVNPYSIAALAMQENSPNALQSACDYFEQWEGTMSFDFRTGSETNQAGDLIMWHDKDPVDNDEYRFGSAAILDIASQHGGKVSSWYQASRFTIKTGKRWCRNASNADIRKTSGGHVLFSTNINLAGSEDLGEIFIDFNITLHTPCAKEISYLWQQSATQSNSTTGSGVALGLTGAGVSSIVTGVGSSTVVPYNSDLMSSPPFSVSSTSEILVLNHKFTTPSGVFVKVDLFCSNVTGPFGLYYYLGGTNVTTPFTAQVFNVTNESTHAGAGSWVVFVPANSPPDSAQIQVVATPFSAAPLPYALSTNPWVYEPVRWGSFAPTFRYTRRNMHEMKKRWEEKRSEEDLDLAVVEKLSESDPLHVERELSTYFDAPRCLKFDDEKKKPKASSLK